jgi:hypothetical protein
MSDTAQHDRYDACALGGESPHGLPNPDIPGITMNHNQGIRVLNHENHFPRCRPSWSDLEQERRKSKGTRPKFLSGFASVGPMTRYFHFPKTDNLSGFYREGRLWCWLPKDQMAMQGGGSWEHVYSNR